MNNPYASPQIYVTGRIISAAGFDSDELFVKYSVVTGADIKKVDGLLEGETFQCIASESEEINIVHFDQPIYFNLSCEAIKGWPKILVEVWSNDSDGRTCLVGYGTGYFPVKPGYSRMAINCWRPTSEMGQSLSEKLLSSHAEFKDKKVVYSNTEKFGINSISTGQVNIEVESIFKDFTLHGIQI